jgi:hypothetical protein
MYRITSQLCEIFDCTDQELEESGILEQFGTWLKLNPDQKISHSLESGEMINGKIADKFFSYYTAEKAH